MFTGNNYPAEIRAALFTLNNQRKCPPGLARHARNLARWTSHHDNRTVTVDCPCGAQHCYELAAGETRWPETFPASCGPWNYTIQIPTWDAWY
jgi:hypothetical protein